MKSKDEIGEIVLDVFRQNNSKAGHIVMMRVFIHSTLTKLNPKEQNIFQEAVNSLIDKGLLIHEKSNPECLRLTDKGFEHIYSKATTKKSKLELSHIIAIGILCVGVLVFFFGNNIFGRFLSTNASEVKKEIISTKTEHKKDTIIASMKLPYLESIPIIDKGLFIKYYYNSFILGGVNIDSVNLNARTVTGERMILKNVNSSIEMSIIEKPYIELKYKGIYYSIKLMRKNYSYNCEIKKDISPTLVLKKYNEF